MNEDDAAVKFDDLRAHEQARKRPAVRWLELDGSLLRFDRELGQFVATLVIERPAFDDRSALVDLIRKMNAVAGALDGKPVHENHFPRYASGIRGLLDFSQAVADAYDRRQPGVGLPQDIVDAFNEVLQRAGYATERF